MSLACLDPMGRLHHHCIAVMEEPHALLGEVLLGQFGCRGGERLGNRGQIDEAEGEQSLDPGFAQTDLRFGDSRRAFRRGHAAQLTGQGVRPGVAGTDQPPCLARPLDRLMPAAGADVVKAPYPPVMGVGQDEVLIEQLHRDVVARGRKGRGVTGILPDSQLQMLPLMRQNRQIRVVTGRQCARDGNAYDRRLVRPAVGVEIGGLASPSAHTIRERSVPLHAIPVPSFHDGNRRAASSLSHGGRAC